MVPARGYLWAQLFSCACAQTHVRILVHNFCRYGTTHDPSPAAVAINPNWNTRRSNGRQKRKSGEEQWCAESLLRSCIAPAPARRRQVSIPSEVHGGRVPEAREGVNASSPRPAPSAPSATRGNAVVQEQPELLLTTRPPTPSSTAPSRTRTRRPGWGRPPPASRAGCDASRSPGPRARRPA